MKRMLLATAAAVGIVSTASAADLRPRPVAPVLPPTFSWTGCYIGGFVGGAWVDDITVTNAYGQAVLPANSWSYGLDSSFIGGGTLGCNWQPIGSPWVLGIEGEIGYIDLSGSASVPFGPNVIFASASIGNTYGMVTGRLGYAGVDRVLFYVKGGAAFVEESVTVSHPALVGITPAFVATASNNDARWTIGGGIEWALGNNWTLKGEYMFIGSDNNSPCAFNPGNPGVVGGLPAANYCWNHSGFDGINTAKIGLNYRFGGLFGGGAPFARY